MPLVEMWKCSKTGELFSSKPAYRTHLRGLVRARAVPASRHAARLEFNRALGPARRTLSSFDELEDFYNRMIPVLVQRNTYPFDAEGQPIPVDIEVSFSEMEWNRRVYPAEWNGVEHIVRSGWSGKLLITGNTIPWSLYDILGHRCGINLYNVERRSKPWNGTIECTAMATVYDVDFPNIAFIARMQGRLDPNSEAIR